MTSSIHRQHAHPQHLHPSSCCIVRSKPRRSFREKRIRILTAQIRIIPRRRARQWGWWGRKTARLSWHGEGSVCSVAGNPVRDERRGNEETPADEDLGRPLQAGAGTVVPAHRLMNPPRWKVWGKTFRGHYWHRIRCFISAEKLSNKLQIIFKNWSNDGTFILFKIPIQQKGYVILKSSPPSTDVYLKIKIKKGLKMYIPK